MLTGLVNVVRTLFKTETAHGANEEEGEAEGVYVEFEGVKVFFFRVSDGLEELRGAVRDGREVDCGAFFGVNLDHIVKVAEKISSLAVQNVFRFDVTMCQPLSLQFFKHCQNLSQKAVDFFSAKGLIFLTPRGHVLMQIHFILFHEEKQREMLFPSLILIFEACALNMATFAAMQAKS
jgi:hypothetical protein